MVRIPQYNRSVTPQNTPQGYLKDNANQIAFGVGVSQAMGEAADSVGRVGEGILGLKEQYDKTKVLEISNMLDKYVNDTLNDKDKGYLYKTGKDAMGKSPEIMDGYDKYSDELISKAGLWGAQQAYIRDIAARKRINLEKYSEAHDKEETDKWQDNVYNDALTNVYSKAINGRNNPLDIEKYKKDGFTILDNYAIIKGWDKDPETLNIKKKEYESNFHAQILDAYLAEGSLLATEYFKKHKDSFNPDVRNKYLQRIHNQEIDYKARATAATLTTKTPEEAYKYIDNIKNIEERDATEREYNRLIRQNEIIKNKSEKDALDKFYTTVLEKNQKGESISFNDIPENVDAETKLNLMRYINSNGNPETDDDTWQMLYEKSVSDAQGFVELDLNRYRGALSEGEFKSFVKRQNDIKTGNYYTTIKDDNAMIDEALKSMGLGKGKKENVAYSEIRSLVKEFEARRGRKINNTELENIVNSLGYKDANGLYIYKQIEKGMGERVGFIRDVINDFAYYQDKHKGVLPSDEEKAKIINKRVSSVILKQNNDMQTSLGSTYQPKIGDIWNGHKITSLYGKRNAPTKGATTDHKGIDLAYRNNEIFSAFASGTVVNVAKSSSLGNYVDIRGIDGTIHRYGHANSISVKSGDFVKVGQMLGRAGSTGISSGPHLHYSKMKNGNFINPLDDNNVMLTQNNKGWAF